MAQGWSREAAVVGGRGLCIHVPSAVRAPVLPDRMKAGLRSERSRRCLVLGLSSWTCGAPCECVEIALFQCL